MGIFDHFNDDPLAEVFNAPAAAPVAPPQSYRAPDYTEKCRKCGGSGKFVGYTGRVFGDCFACKGKGTKAFVTSPEKRAANRASAQVRKERDAKEFGAQLAAYIETHREVFAWLTQAAARNEQRGGTFDFPQKLIDSVAKYGSLTENQLAAVQRLIAKDAERNAARKSAQDNAVAVDVSKVQAAFEKAKADASDEGEGVKWLKLRLDTFVFADAPARGQWPAAIFVSEGKGESRKKLGRISGGKFIRSFACDDATEARVVAAAADPAAAAKAYGLRTGSCSCCGRELTNKESRELGIGPICARRFFGGE